MPSVVNVHTRTHEMMPRMLDEKVHEDDISTVIERSCDPETKDGRWITQYDIVEVSRKCGRG